MPGHSAIFMEQRAKPAENCCRIIEEGKIRRAQVRTAIRKNGWKNEQKANGIQIVVIMSENMNVTW